MKRPSKIFDTQEIVDWAFHLAKKIKNKQMKKILFIITLMMLAGISCKKSFLDVGSPSSVDEDFVFSSTGETFKVMVGLYEIWRGNNNNLFYAIEVPGSD